MDKQIITIGRYMNNNIRLTEEVKTIFVSDLPNCYYKERMTDMVKNPETTLIITVAKLGTILDWACYIGWPEISELKEEYQTSDNYYYCSTLHSKNQVLAYGDKLEKETADQLFPNWSELKYRT